VSDHHLIATLIAHLSPRRGPLRLALADARRGLAPRRRRALLTGLGIALAAAMLSAALVVSDGLGLGFTRAERAADLPDLIIRFNSQSYAAVAKRIRALPDVAAFATRTEFTGQGVAANGHRTGSATAEVIGSGRRGYAVVAGHDLASTGNQVLVEKAWAASWGMHLGGTLRVPGLGPERIVGLAEAPDNVGYPLAPPRFYLSQAALVARFGRRAVPPQVNYAEIWVRNPRYLNELLVQARATSFGLRDVRFVTRAGIRVLVHQAAGIVIDLLVALSLIALATAGAMLAASARAEVQRRLGTIGVQRAVGASGGYVTLVHTLEAALVAAPAAAIGCAAGALLIAGPSAHLLELLNEPSLDLRPGGGGEHRSRGGERDQRQRDEQVDDDPGRLVDEHANAVAGDEAHVAQAEARGAGLDEQLVEVPRVADPDLGVVDLRGYRPVAEAGHERRL
jgi:hypothetical protein